VGVTTGAATPAKEGMWDDLERRLLGLKFLFEMMNDAFSSVPVEINLSISWPNLIEVGV
jgi:hypothetical protein